VGRPGSDTAPGRLGRAFTGELCLIMLTQKLVTGTYTVTVYSIDVSEKKDFHTLENCFSEYSQEISDL